MNTDACRPQGEHADAPKVVFRPDTTRVPQWRCWKCGVEGVDGDVGYDGRTIDVPACACDKATGDPL